MLLVLTVFVSGCMMLTNGHGLIKGYRYNVKKHILEQAMLSVVKQDTSMYFDTVKRYIAIQTGNKIDTVLDNYYNDNINYYTLVMRNASEEDRYIFRFYGNKEYWDSSATSEIFICYEQDGRDLYKEGSGKGSDKEEKLTSFFKNKVIDKIDKVLKINHKVEE